MKLQYIFRNLYKNRLFTSINTIGLSIGLASVILIANWVVYETGFDTYNTRFEDIYQLNFAYPDGNLMAGSPNPLAPLLEENVAVIEKAARLRGAPEFAYKYKGNMFFEENGITADPEIFDMLDLQVIAGNPKEALENTNAMIVTRSFANRYFGNESALGKEILVEGQNNIGIKAIIEDVPKQSHIQFDHILPHKLLEQKKWCGLNWGDPNFRTYVMLQPNSNQKNAGEAITQIAAERGMPHVKWGGAVAHLRPMKDIYLDYEVSNRLGELGDYRNTYVFVSIAILILALACINYINLAISTFSKRKQNSSVKKICGAKGMAIFKEHFTENAFVVVFSFILAILIVLPVQGLLTNLGYRGFSRLNLEVSSLLVYLSVLLTALLLSAVYPSILFAGKKAGVLVKRYKNNEKEKTLGLVIFQNVIAVCLIIVALSVNYQLSFIQDKNLGFETGKVGYTYLRGQISEKTPLVKARIMQNPNISDVCLKDCLPFNQRNGTTGLAWYKEGKWQNEGDETQVVMETTRIDDNYFPMMGVEFKEGRNFSRKNSADLHNYIVNEAAVKAMGLTNPIGNGFHLYGEKGEIVGVIKDTYFKSFHEEIRPQVFHLYEDETKESYFSALFFKVGNNTKDALTYIEKVWEENNPGIPFEYHFLDKEYENLYKKEAQTSKLISIFSILAIFLACLGLFGQSVIAGEKRMKEIGVRKVNGAKVSEIILLLNKSTVLRIVIAFVLAVPVSYYAIFKWLQNFAYKANVSFGLFALAGLIIMLISLLTVSMQSYKSAIKNPVKCLRYE